MSHKPVLADFHIHSNKSFDSCLSVSQIEKSAIRNNVEWISITDHNTTKAPTELWKGLGWSLSSPYITLESGLNVVSGVEVTCRVMSVANLKGNTCKVHLLLYGVDLSQDSPITKLMKIKHKNDLDYDLRRLNYLLSLKPEVKIPLAEIQEWFRVNDVDGEPSNKQIMDFLDDKRIDLGIYSEKRLVKVLDKMPPVQRLDLDAEKVIKVAHSCGGVAVMAHPNCNIRRTSHKMDLLEVLLKAGLDGFELLHNGANEDTTILIEKAIKKYARKRSMVYTGGSDTHNLLDGNTIGKWNGNKLITIESQENGLIKRMENIQKNWDGESSRIKIDDSVEKYIMDCAQRTSGIKAKYKNTRKPKMFKGKKHFKHQKMTALEYFYTAEDELER